MGIRTVLELRHSYLASMGMYATVSGILTVLLSGIIAVISGIITGYFSGIAVSTEDITFTIVFLRTETSAVQGHFSISRIHGTTGIILT